MTNYCNVAHAGYYFNEKLGKLARLRKGGRLPLDAGPWVFLAPEGVLSSTEVVHDLLESFPELDPRRLTYASRSPHDRRERPRPLRLVRTMLLGLACLGLGVAIGRLSA